MQAPGSLSDEQKATLLHTLTFLRLCGLHLEAALPAMRDLDEVRGRNLADMAKLCAENIKKHFPGILLGLFLALVLCQPASGQERRTYSVPFHTVNGLVLLDARLNDKPAVFLLDTGANNSVADYRAAGFDSLKLDALRSTGKAGAEGACIVREVKLSLDRRSWLNRRVCIMDLSDASRRMGTRIDGFVGQDVLTEFSAVRIDYKAHTVTLEN